MSRLATAHGAPQESQSYGLGLPCTLPHCAYEDLETQTEALIFLQAHVKHAFAQHNKPVMFPSAACALAGDKMPVKHVCRGLGFLPPHPSLTMVGAAGAPEA